MEDEKNSNLVLLRAKPPKKIKRFVFHFLLVIISLTLFFLILNKDLVSEHFQNLKIISKISTENLIKNGDFEDEKISAEDKKLPIGWDLIGDCKLGEGITIETISQADLIVFGKQSLKITANKGCGITRRLDFVKGKKYRIQVNILIKEGEAEVIFRNSSEHQLATAIFNQKNEFQTTTIPINGSVVSKGKLEIIGRTDKNDFVVDGVKVEEVIAIPITLPKKIEMPDYSTPETWFKTHQNSEFFLPLDESSKKILKNNFQKSMKEESFLFKPAQCYASGGSCSVQPIYFVPSDHQIFSQYTSAINSAMENIKNWYASQTGVSYSQEALLIWHDSHTYNQIRCGEEQDCIKDPTRADNFWSYILDVIGIETGKSKVVFSQGAGGCAGGMFWRKKAGFVIVGDWVLQPISGYIYPGAIPCDPANWPCNRNTALGTIAHELGHTFNLPHPDPYNYLAPPDSIMCCHWSYPNTVLYDVPEYSEKRTILQNCWFGGFSPDEEAPLIINLFPADSVRGGMLDIRGERFGRSSSDSQVLFNDKSLSPENILFWDNDFIKVIIPQWVDLGYAMVKVKASSLTGSGKTSVGTWISVFDKPREIPRLTKMLKGEISETVLTNSDDSSPPHFEWEKIVGNFYHSVNFDLINSSTDVNVHTKVIYQENYKIPLSVISQLDFDQWYRWRLCAFNYYEQSNYCKENSFVIRSELVPPPASYVDEFPKVVEPISVVAERGIYRGGGGVLVPIRLGASIPVTSVLSDDKGIEKIKLWYKEENAPSEVFNQQSPSSGWVLLHSFQNCPQGSSLCRFHYVWENPLGLVKRKIYYLMMEAYDNENGNPHYGISGSGWFSGWYRPENCGNWCKNIKLQIALFIDEGVDSFTTPTPPFTPTPTPTPLPQFGVCGGCDHDAWGGCTPKGECRLINDADLCGRNHKPGTPCCLRDRCCNPSACQQSCGYGDPNTYCHQCTRFWNNPPNGPWCTNWDLTCGAGKPAKPRLKSPANNSSLADNGSSINLSWYAFGEGLSSKCGEQLEGNWPKWDDCNNSWHWGTPASCIPEIGDGSNAGDRSCWGYVCAKGSFGVPTSWRQYKVLLKGPQDNDFREICQIEDVPNPSTIGQGLASNKTSCSFTPSSNGNYQWFVRAGYVVSTAGGISYNFTNSSPYSFSVSGLISPTPTFTVTPIPTLTFTPTPTSTLTLVPSVTPKPTNTPTRSPTSGLTPTATSQPTNVPTNTPTRAPTATPIGPTATPTTPPPTPTPTYIAQCRYCRVYDKDWFPVIDINKISVGDELYFTTRGSTDHPQGITKARFRINGKADLTWCRGNGLAIVNNWCETSLVHKQVEYYLPYKISEPGYYTIGSMVYNPALGWF